MGFVLGADVQTVNSFDMLTSICSVLEPFGGLQGVNSVPFYNSCCALAGNEGLLSARSTDNPPVSVMNAAAAGRRRFLMYGERREQSKWRN